MCSKSSSCKAVSIAWVVLVTLEVELYLSSQEPRGSIDHWEGGELNLYCCGLRAVGWFHCRTVFLVIFPVGIEIVVK